MAGVFSVVGVVGLILLIIIGTWFIRRRRRDRFEDEVLDFSPTTHINGVSDGTSYPNSLHRTNSIGSQYSRRAPTVNPGYGAAGYGSTQGYGAAGAAAGGYGYYNNNPPMQQALSGPTTYGALPPALRPGAPGQNPFSDFNRSRTPSPEQGNDAAYGGYMGR